MNAAGGVADGKSILMFFVLEHYTADKIRYDSHEFGGGSYNHLLKEALISNRSF